RSSLAARWLIPFCLRSGWKPMHQHPPKIPLLRSTSSAKASQVEASRGWVVNGIVESFRAWVLLSSWLTGLMGGNDDKLSGPAWAVRSVLIRHFGQEPGEFVRLAEHRPVA